MFLQNYIRQAGGVSANALVTLSRFGLSCAFLGLRGQDEAGTLLEMDFSQNNVCTRCYLTDPSYITPESFLIVDPDRGERSALTWQKAFPADCEMLSRFPLPNPDHLKYVLLDSHHPEIGIQIAKWAKEHRIEVVMDPGTYKSYIWEFTPYVDHMIVPDDFLTGWVGPGDIGNGLSRLARQGNFKTVAATAGVNGVYALVHGKMVHIPALKLDYVVDCTGAGDVFHGAYVYGLTQGWDIQKRLEWANVCAGLKCMKAGGRDSIPALKDVEKYYYQYKREGNLS